MMNSLFKKPAKAQRVFRVENLNPSENVVSTMHVSRNQKEYSVCLCMSGKTTRTTFTSECSALGQMEKYRMQYKNEKVG